MLTLSGIRIRNGKEAVAHRIDWIAFVLGALSGSVYGHLTTSSFENAFSVVLIIYITASYLMLSFCKACEIKTFPHDKTIRIVFLLIVAIIVVPEAIDAVVYCRLRTINIAGICLVLIALQVVINGFFFRKESEKSV